MICGSKNVLTIDSFMMFFRARFGNKKNPILLSAVESSGHSNTTVSKVFFMVALCNRETIYIFILFYGRPM